ncbi:hypothetical protein NPIL_209851 [Nephila pilipes]|uniref:Uncharacterized protein n=1 Tax=Nephila pilipes TaxID=299642 RepID=A0A8X6TXA1_NEPPI|nr:hypothetical protein NPIL_209851 [Nephila pilipes]
MVSSNPLYYIHFANTFCRALLSRELRKNQFPTPPTDTDPSTKAFDLFNFQHSTKEAQSWTNEFRLIIPLHFRMLPVSATDRLCTGGPKYELIEKTIWGASPGARGGGCQQ